jgi:hypothetical protein
MSKSNFEINTDDYMGFEFEEYLNAINAMAISKPAEYYQMRALVLKNVKKKVIKEVYTAYYTLLTTQVVGTFNGQDLIPNYPTQKASKFALEASATTGAIINKALEIVIPIDFTNIAHSKLMQKAEAAKIDA